jgi:hypothetical protein
VPAARQVQHCDEFLTTQTKVFAARKSRQHQWVLYTLHALLNIPRMIF